MTALLALLVPTSVVVIFMAFLVSGELIAHPMFADVFVVLLAIPTLGAGPLLSWTVLVGFPYSIARSFLCQLVWNWVWLRRKLLGWHFLAEEHAHGKLTAAEKLRAKSLSLMAWKLMIANIAIFPATALASFAYYKAVHDGLELGSEWYVAIAATALVGLITEAFIVRNRNRKEAEAHDAEHHDGGGHAHGGHGHHAPHHEVHRTPFRGTPMSFGAQASTPTGGGGGKKGKGGGNARPKRNRGAPRT